MNRLVIIGNGFDLAHGLPTSYRDFIDDFWMNLREYIKNDFVKELIFIKTTNRDLMDYYLFDIKNYDDFDKKLMSEFNKRNLFYLSNTKEAYLLNPRDLLFKFKSEFFKRVCVKNTEKWVDIENEYYKSLINIARESDLNDEERNYKVTELNKDFENLKMAFEYYLTEKINKNYNFQHFGGESQDFFKILNLLKPISKLSNEQNIIKEFSKKVDQEEIEIKFKKESINLVINQVYFLNFNYTFTGQKYQSLLKNDERIDAKINHIHGVVGNTTENKINFGFGDEMDDDYKTIENIDDNEFLRNFKSFQYLQNSNYTELINFVNSDKFQVYIMGHSCGLSDRTLLNTIFEHKNCRSIKVFYHQRPDGSDNYTEIIQNISRHFVSSPKNSTV